MSVLVDPKLINFCRHIHLGMSISAAGRMAEVKSPHRQLKKPAVAAYLLSLQHEARKKFDISRDDVVQGLQKAIEQADLLEEPMAQIAGWREIAKVLGHYEPETKKIILSTQEEERKRQLGLLDERKLLELAGGDVIDAEFDLVSTDEGDDTPRKATA